VDTNFHQDLFSLFSEFQTNFESSIFTLLCIEIKKYKQIMKLGREGGGTQVVGLKYSYFPIIDVFSWIQLELLKWQSSALIISLRQSIPAGSWNFFILMGWNVKG